MEPFASCVAAVLKERALLVSRETIRPALHRLEFRWRRPRPVPPPKDPETKRERLKEILKMLKRAGSFFQDETRSSPKFL
ncbi:winged helix-turn-helix domain-containing protein [Rubrobacter xylanophilus]|uniref:winged helix-turn-helix domain-containing protein n=1 Tax=Rubrobacter xylanophilus TaxID=49319 RepID=UPI0012EA0D2D